MISSKTVSDFGHTELDIIIGSTQISLGVYDKETLRDLVIEILEDLYNMPNIDLHDIYYELFMAEDL